MPLPRLKTVSRWTAFALFLVVAAVAVWLPAYGGRYLQHEDPLQKSDAIFVLSGTRVERLLEAVDIYKAGYAPAIILSPGIIEDAEVALRARGIRFPAEADLFRNLLLELGVPASAIVPVEGYVDNTAQEANLLRSMVKKNHWRRVIIVTSKYHTRRAAFAFRRGLKGTGAEVVMRASKYDQSDPANWWRSRPDFRFASSEFQKLLAYRLGLGG